MKLSDLVCKTAKPKDKPYKLFDGDGLYLEVLPSGKKLWRLKFRHLGKESRISFGAYPLVSLSEARQERHQAKKLLLQHKSPTTIRKNEKAALTRQAENTFKAVAMEWMAQNKHRWSAGYYRKVEQGLELNVYPFIGLHPIAQITPLELLNDCLRKIENRDALDIATRTRQICGQIFRYGIATGRCERDCAADLRGALKINQVEHFRTLTEKDLPDFIKALERNEARLFERTRRAVWLSLYTFCRPKEIRMARWQDMDLAEGLWIIPAELMKKKRDHIVPLSKQVIALLQEQRKELQYLETEWVFPGQVSHRKPMSDATVNKAIKLLGFGEKMVAHGFRALARTTIREKLGYESEIIEKQLAHEPSNSLRGAYDRTQFLDKRKIMMQDWADYLTNLGRKQHKSD
ncbi:integrase [Arsenicibacter rosenii]|uniref:Integrase n=2 Tax=Arsenicibacter rosenii TaxID=1750698 RepID=A0A1S2VCN2_9BACT|nr:integrase [Arsenicibacter rosenii]